MIFFYFLSQKAVAFNNPIYLSITLHHKISYRLKLPFTIALKDWDPEKQRPVNIYSKKHKELNILLNRIKIHLAEYLQDKPGISSKEISEEIKKICSEKTTAYPEGSFLFMMSSYLEAKKESLCLSTYRRYVVFLRMMEKFEGFIGRNIITEEVDSTLIRQFYTFGKMEEYTESTLNRTAEFIKTILNFAERQGIITQVRQLEIPKLKTVRRILVLDEKEIVKIRKTAVPTELKRAKDWLLISCYTGQRISDFMRFNTGQLIKIDHKPCISFIQQKTGKEIILPLHPEVLKIMKKYGGTFPQAIEKAVYNVQIKEVALLAGINEPVKMRKRKGFRGKETCAEKWENISSHIGRRSFASNFYGKIPTPLLMQATGHSTEQMFLNYINPIHHSRIVSLGDYFDRLYSEGAGS
ncbi:tyrosine-type recombinase/integrase [Chryseobacterium camelliae]|uniref:tyrosine-type recombinase/integrase n=1 Tax=Chryseobacterium camelliae TaxID=1265445 RepID=UPI00285B4249|nr:tyrosine-type recombinase/integrase [Chryseobacterium camelliae]MDR6515881.1 integrase [Chryseobacterium camelliae]